VWDGDDYSKIDGALSDILRNEEAFQNHLKEIDMELKGHTLTDKGITESTFLKMGGTEG